MSTSCSGELKIKDNKLLIIEMGKYVKPYIYRISKLSNNKTIETIEILIYIFVINGNFSPYIVNENTLKNASS